MMLADARAMIPELEVVEADEDADRRLLEAIADWCDRYTPLVALDLPHGLLLDVTGAAALFGGERALLDGVKSALKSQGFAVQAALAGASAASRALARYADGAIALPGAEAQAVAPLPVAALNLEASIQHALKHAGLKTIGDVASRMRAELAKRFGGEMVATLDCALGRAEKPISPRRALPDTIAEHRFADPVVSEAVIQECDSRARPDVAGVLEIRGEGARVLVASFFRAAAKSVASPSRPEDRCAIPFLSRNCSASGWMGSPIRSIPASASISSGSNRHARSVANPRLRR